MSEIVVRQIAIILARMADRNERYDAFFEPVIDDISIDYQTDGCTHRRRIFPSAHLREARQIFHRLIQTTQKSSRSCWTSNFQIQDFAFNELLNLPADPNGYHI